MGAINGEEQYGGKGQDEGRYCLHHIVGNEQPERMVADCKPEPRVPLILAHQSFGVTVYCVEGSQVSIGRCPLVTLAALTFVWVVECPHS